MSYEKFEELSWYDLKKLFNETRFWELNFDEIVEKAENIKKLLLSLKEYDFFTYLLESESRDINWVLDTFLWLIKSIENFSVTQDNAPSAQKSIISSFYGYHEEWIKKIRPLLNNLKIEHLQSTNLEEDLRKQVDKYTTLNNDLEWKLWEINNKLSQLTIGSVEVSTTLLSKEYDEQKKEYETEKDERFSKWRMALYILIILVVIVLISYVLTQIFRIETFKNVFNVEFWVIFAILVSLLFYVVNFCFRKYDILSNIATQNKHRSDVAKTFQYFVAAWNEPYEAFLKEVARALFWHTDSGYITKKATEINTPLIEMITKQFNKWE
jgi:hypothetical protein